MGNDRDRDDRFRGRGEDENRWQGNRYEREGGSFGNWGSNRSRGDWEDRDRNRSSGDDRGFMERAGEQVRSWFSDDDRGDRQHGRGGDRDVRWERSSEGQFRGDPVHHREMGRGDQDRPDRDFRFNRNDRFDSNPDRPNSASAFGNQSDDRYGGGSTSGAMAGNYDTGSGGAADTWGGSGFGGNYDRGRRFDRIDAGSTGTQGAHPMSAATGGGYESYGVGGAYSGGGSSAREAAIIRQAQAGGGGRQQMGQAQPHDHHDRHYSEWRQRQIDDLDRDYHDYRQEHQSKFEQEFGGWRQKRQTQRQHVGRAREHMEVLGSDGQHVGTVDKVRGDRIILTKNDENAGGMHHSIPCSWVENVDEKVTINKTAKEAMDAWTNEDGQRALFEREDQGSDGPHVLNRSFSGTYDEKKG